ncbi:MAG: dihydroxyacetone kinase subunit DhaK [Actinobacteria bacterium]|nr:dihydroxyacetone kinase subunit DhaK [Actinomycetota bacterium]
MQKILNQPKEFVNEMLEGILEAYPNQLRAVGGDNHSLVRKDSPVKGKVGITTGGGSGHLPLFLGYVGKGLLDGVAVGDVFQSPTAEQMLAVTKDVDSGAGVLYIYGNYGGDVMNFDLAAELAAAEGIRVETILGADDVASAPKGEEPRRRGIAGIFFLYKVAGAAAASGKSLDEVVAVTKKAAAHTRTMGVALSPVTLPTVGHPTFEVKAGEMEIGMGIHGEPGIKKSKLETADQITQQLISAIKDDLDLKSGETVCVLMNSLGATPPEELYIMYRQAKRKLSSFGVDVARVYVGEFATSLEMAGASISVIRVDSELLGYINAPAHTPFFTQA